MVIELTEIQRDLDLKRAAGLSTAELPTAVLRELLDGLPPVHLDAHVLGELGDEEPLTPAAIARPVAVALAALTTLEPASYPAPARRRLVREIVGSVGRRLDIENATVLTSADLSVVIEAALVEHGAIDLAKLLVLRRTPSDVASSPALVGLRLIRRSGQVVAWREEKIALAIGKAFMSLGLDTSPAADLARRVTVRAEQLGLAYVPIEVVQDLVQEELVLAGQMRVAERFIVYRAERALVRARSAPDEPGVARPDVVLTSPDGDTTWNAEELHHRIRFAGIGLDLQLSEEQLEQELRRSFPERATAEELRRLFVLNAKSLMERDSDFSLFAARILLTYVYEETLPWRITDGIGALRDAHRRALRPALERGVKVGRVDPALLDYDLERLAQSLDPSADLDFDYLGIQTLYDRYLLVDKTGSAPIRLEAPQIFWLRVAMGVCLPEAGDREARVLALYSVYRGRRFCSATPTLFNSGTPHSQLSSCYLYVVDDSLESIVQRGIAENAMCSKWAGGLGGSWTKVRGTGSHIDGTNGESQGIVPFLKLHNDQLVAVNQGGKRAGAGCAYLETWHNDIRDFLELRRNTGDERRRTHDMNTANWVPDLFMKRMEARQHWTLFRSSEVPDLHDLYGRAFEERYTEYERLADDGQIFGERIEAIELWKLMLRMLFETGHPWITFKDACNIRSPQDHVGVIHSSNLCTEITLNTSADETAVCNLGSIVIDSHLSADGEIDHVLLRETVRVAVRALDNVIDVNFYPTEAARTANRRHRPVGLGLMGLHYALQRKELAFSSPEAIAFGDEVTEAVAFYAYEASSDLAAERGTYSTYAGSKWDRGLLPPDTIDVLEAERGQPVDVVRGGLLDWEPLRAKIRSQGMRNSNVIAIAPTATIANIMGTSPCIEPLYKNLFVKSNLSGDFVVLNPHLVRDLKKSGLWNPDLAAQLKYFDGELVEIPGIPESLREVYRTAFEIDSGALIEAGARRQKWIDQSQSLNLFLAAPDMKELSHMYRHAWRAGLKTTYYLRTLGASTIEKATVVRIEPGRTPASASACSIEATVNGEHCEACQ
jgi:ribonucleoside-diphosphate reductase alpha chain